MLFGNFANCLDINHLHGGVGGGLDPYQLSVRLYDFIYILKFGHINEVHVDVKLIFGIHSHVSLSSSIYIVTSNNVVTTLQYVKNGSSGSTTTCKCCTELAVLNGS